MKSIFVLLTSLLPLFLSAQSAMQLEVSLPDFKSDTLFLGSLVGSRHYLLDTAVLNKTTNTFTFDNPTERAEGVYIVITKLGEKAFQILLQPGNQRFKIEATLDNVYESANIVGSTDNEAYMHYLAYSQPLFASLDTLYPKLAKSAAVAYDIDQTEKKLLSNIKVAKTVLSASSLFSKLVSLDEQRLKLGGIKSSKEAADFFAQLPMADIRFANAPQLEAIVEKYMLYLVPQSADTAVLAMDWILAQTKPSSETYKHYIRYFLNMYSRPDMANLDALYVRISQNYISKGEAPFMDTSVVNRIARRAATVELLTVGKVIPNARLSQRDNSKLALYDITAPYTLVFFWDPDCGHCKKVSPIVTELYNELHAKGLEVYAVCCKPGSGTPKCWEYIDKTPDIATWLHVNDPNDSNRFRTNFDVRTTPMCYLLDSEKRIIYKVIGENLNPKIVRELVQKK